MICQNCGEELKNGTKECPLCSSLINTMPEKALSQPTTSSTVVTTVAANPPVRAPYINSPINEPVVPKTYSSKPTYNNSKEASAKSATATIDRSASIKSLKYGLLTGIGLLFLLICPLYASGVSFGISSGADVFAAISMCTIYFFMGYGCPHWAKKLGIPAAKAAFAFCSFIFMSIWWTIFGALLAFCVGIVVVASAFMYPTFFMGMFTGAYTFAKDIQCILFGRYSKVVSVIVQVAIYIPIILIMLMIET